MSEPGQQLLPGMEQPVEQAAVQQETAPQETVMNLLRDFGRREGCTKYKSDGERIKMITAYLWLRQLTDGLTFERFLERFADVADFNAENLKNPEEALKHHCPRNKGVAEKRGLPQWSAAECVGILSEYINMVRHAETTGAPVAVTLAEYLSYDAPAFKRGEWELPVADPIRSSAAAKKTTMAHPTPADPATGLPPTGNGQVPTEVGQRAIYQLPGSGRQMRGTMGDILLHHDKSYADFVTDEGESYEACNINHFTLLDEPPVTQTADVVGKKTLWIPKHVYPHTRATLDLDSPMANVKVGELIQKFSADFAELKKAADFSIMNGETGPYVDPSLCCLTSDEILVELSPRDNLLGSYTFELAEGVVVVEVKTRE